jgi:cytosine/adenosine deaminase-related metal-dependent hydrolase
MKISLIFLSAFWVTGLAAAPLELPDRERGEGPFERLILRDVMVINGEGAPPVGPADLLIEGSRITRIRQLGIATPVPRSARIPARDGDRVLELAGHYVLPGFIDLHAHFGGAEQGVPAEYAAKLWLAHGITTIREPGSGNGLAWVQRAQQRSERNEVAAPRIVPYVFFGMGRDDPIETPEQARRWVKEVSAAGAHGVKFFGATPQVMQAALEEWTLPARA